MTLELGATWCRKVGEDVQEMPGPVEDEATLGEIGVVVDGVTLTRALDDRTGQARDSARLSAYRLAEWLTWNWWRLRWEPSHQNVRRDRRIGWRQSHDLAGIGGGWLWPNVTITCDGLRVVLDARPSPEVGTEPLRYVTSRRVVVSAAAFEAGVDDLVKRVLARLDAWSLTETDLDAAWRELAVEREDPELDCYRRIEACLGFDVDEADPRQVDQVIVDGRSLGTAAMFEVAADRFLTAAGFREAARRAGFEAAPDDRVTAPAGAWDRLGQRPAWEVGVGAASGLRRREQLGDGPLSDHRLADLCAVDRRALHAGNPDVEMAFALDDRHVGSRIVLRSRWRTGRRFEAARLLADSLLAGTDDRLRPATGAATYRQKTQRAFAAELLCPVESLLDVLADDFSDDARVTAAERFGVSPLAVNAVLANHGFVDWEEVRDPDVRLPPSSNRTPDGVRCSEQR